jgi:ATP-dependent Clp protease, protease subunit
MDLLTLSDGGKVGELIIYDDIGYDPWFGEGVDAKSVHAALKDAGDKLEHLTVRINSPGGSVRDGNAIYNELHRHKAHVVVEIDSLAASAATVIAMAGDEIHMAKNGLFMIHEASGGAWGNAHDLETTAQVLRKINDTAGEVYAARTGRAKDELLSWMKDELWMTADEALTNGFITKVNPAKPAPALSTDAKQRGQRMLATFRHAPEQALQMYGGALSQFADRTLRTSTPPNVTTPRSEAPQPVPAALRPTALGRLATEARGVRLRNL